MRDTTVPTLDQYSDGGLETVPAALAACIDHHQRQWL